MKRILGVLGVIAIALLLGASLAHLREEGVSLVGAEASELFFGGD